VIEQSVSYGLYGISLGRSPLIIYCEGFSIQIANAAAAERGGLQGRQIEKYIPIAKTTFTEAIRIAHAEEKTGPGIKGF
jgi:hypothetical protein